MPVLLILNLGGTNDLDLNSARNEIIYSDKWNEFEQNLAFIICSKIKEKVKPEYWEKLSKIYKKTKCENFEIGLNKILSKKK